MHHVVVDYVSLENLVALVLRGLGRMESFECKRHVRQPALAQLGTGP